MASDRKRRARCALCDTTESLGGWFYWNNRPTVKFCEKCWNLAESHGARGPRRVWALYANVRDRVLFWRR